MHSNKVLTMSENQALDNTMHFAFQFSLFTWKRQRNQVRLHEELASASLTWRWYVWWEAEWTLCRPRGLASVIPEMSWNRRVSDDT